LKIFDYYYLISYPVFLEPYLYVIIIFLFPIGDFVFFLFYLIEGRLAIKRGFMENPVDPEEEVS